MLTIGEVAELAQVPARRAEGWVERGMLKISVDGGRKWRRFDAGELAIAIGLANLDKISPKLCNKDMAETLRESMREGRDVHIWSRYAALTVQAGQLSTDAVRAFAHMTAVA